MLRFLVFCCIFVILLSHSGEIEETYSNSVVIGSRRIGSNDILSNVFKMLPTKMIVKNGGWLTVCLYDLTSSVSECDDDELTHFTKSFEENSEQSYNWALYDKRNRKSLDICRYKSGNYEINPSNYLSQFVLYCDNNKIIFKDISVLFNRRFTVKYYLNEYQEISSGDFYVDIIDGTPIPTEVLKKYEYGLKSTPSITIENDVHRIYIDSNVVDSKSTDSLKIYACHLNKLECVIVYSNGNTKNKINFASIIYNERENSIDLRDINFNSFQDSIISISFKKVSSNKMGYSSSSRMRMNSYLSSISRNENTITWSREPLVIKVSVHSVGSMYKHNQKIAHTELNENYEWGQYVNPIYATTIGESGLQLKKWANSLEILRIDAHVTFKRRSAVSSTYLRI